MVQRAHLLGVITEPPLPENAPSIGDETDPESDSIPGQLRLLACQIVNFLANAKTSLFKIPRKYMSQCLARSVNQSDKKLPGPKS
jgi:hypothetical protein